MIKPTASIEERLIKDLEQMGAHNPYDSVIDTIDTLEWYYDEGKPFKYARENTIKELSCYEGVAMATRIVDHIIKGYRVSNWEWR